MDDDDTWASIIANDGSVQHLGVPDDVKEVLRQRWRLTSDGL